MLVDYASAAKTFFRFFPCAVWIRLREFPHAFEIGLLPFNKILNDQWCHDALLSVQASKSVAGQRMLAVRQNKCKLALLKLAYPLGSDCHMDNTK